MILSLFFIYVLTTYVMFYYFISFYHFLWAFKTKKMKYIYIEEFINNSSNSNKMVQVDIEQTMIKNESDVSKKTQIRNQNLCDIICCCLKCKNSCSLCWFYSCLCGCNYDTENHINCLINKNTCFSDFYEYCILYYIPCRYIGTPLLNNNLIQVEDYMSGGDPTCNVCKCFGYSLRSICCPIASILVCVINLLRIIIECTVGMIPID